MVATPSLLLTAALMLAGSARTERLPPLPPPAVPPHPQEKFESPLNAWHLYLRAAQLRDGDAEWPGDPRPPVTPEKVERWAQYLERQGPALEALDRAVAAPYCVVREYDFVAPMPEMAQMRGLGRLLLMQGRVRMYDVDAAGAVDAWLDTVEMGHDVMQEGPLIARLVGIAIDGMASRPLLGLVQQGLGTAADYRQIIARLADLEAQRFPYAGTLAREYACGHQLVERAMADPKQALLLVEATGGAWSLRRIGAYLAALAEPGVIVSNYRTYWAMLIEDARRPYPRRDLALEREGLLGPVNEPMLTVNRRVRVTDVRDVARLRAVAVMAALQLYRLDNGRLPMTLDALRPAYLAEMPLDPFSEQSFRYLRPPGVGFVVYSLGPDGDDDRAKVEWEWDEDQPSDGDIVFREGEGEP